MFFRAITSFCKYFIRLLIQIGLILILLGSFTAVVYYFWFQAGDLTTNFEAKAEERAAVIALIKSGRLKSQQEPEILESGIKMSEIELSESYNNVTRNDKVTVIEKGDILEVHFPVKVYGFGDSRLDFIYNSDPKLEDKNQFTKEDFLWLRGNLLEVEKVAPNWYKVLR